MCVCVVLILWRFFFIQFCINLFIKPHESTRTCDSIFLSTSLLFLLPTGVTCNLCFCRLVFLFQMSAVFLLSNWFLCTFHYYNGSVNSRLYIHVCCTNVLFFVYIATSSQSAAAFCHSKYSPCVSVRVRKFQQYKIPHVQARTHTQRSIIDKWNINVNHYTISSSVGRHWIWLK